MRTLNISLEDREYNRLNRVKRKSGYTWKNFIMSLCE